MTTYINIFNFTFYEPMTSFTDLVLFVLCLFFAFKILSKKSIYHRSWGLLFLFSGISALCGFISHGFGPYLDSLNKIVWAITLIAIGIASAILLFLISTFVVSENIKRVLHIFLFLKFVLYTFTISKYPLFTVAIADYFPVLLVITGLYGYQFVKTRLDEYQWVFIGLILSIVGAGVQQSGFSMHQHFNHNDLFHVIQMAGFLSLFIGVNSCTKKAVL